MKVKVYRCLIWVHNKITRVKKTSYKTENLTSIIILKILQKCSLIISPELNKGWTIYIILICTLWYKFEIVLINLSCHVRNSFQIWKATILKYTHVKVNHVFEALWILSLAIIKVCYVPWKLFFIYKKFLNIVSHMHAGICRGNRAKQGNHSISVDLLRSDLKCDL